MAIQYEDPCVLWVRFKDGKEWVRYLNCRSHEIAETQAGRLARADRRYKLGETMKILSPDEEP